MQPLTRQTLKIFWEHAKKYRWQMWAIGIGVLMLTAGQTYIPLIYRDLLNLLAGDATTDKLTAGLHLVKFILVFNLIRMGLWRVTMFVHNYFESRVMADLTNTCYEYLHKHSFGFFSSRFVGSLVTKVKRYERAFEVLDDQIVLELGRTLLDTIMILAVLLVQYTLFGLIVFVWVGIFIIGVYLYERYKLRFNMIRAKADTHTTAQLADSITNNANIKLFTSYGRENQRFAAVTKAQFLARKKTWDLGTIGDMVQSVFITILEFTIVYFSVTRWYHGILGVGDVALLQMYVLRMSEKLWNAGRNIRHIYEAIADANEMTELITMPHEITDMPGAKRLAFKKGKIDFTGVSFSYHREKAILNNFSLSVAAGERVALIGPSGGGKSTIIKLLLRLHDVTAGKISIDGQDISQVTQDSLREQLSLVPQDPILFHRSLAENIRYAKPNATDEEVVRAATLAHAHEFISGFKDGYETLVGERGIKLSGGERQRVAIARAILKNAPILLLDEATSSLDSESEQLIQEALTELMKGRTTIVVAHRLSTIMKMDRIVVIERGSIVEDGKHNELLKVRKGMYQKLWGIQAGGFRPAKHS